MNPQTIEIIKYSIAGLFAFSALVQIFYYLFFYLRIAFWKPQTTAETKLPPVSVIVCARNEDENLRKFLPAILEQKYPDFEVILVNDCSEDETELVSYEFLRKYKNFYVTKINKDSNFAHGKKLALTVGIKAARHEWLLLTDADCKVTSDEWIASMSRNFTENTSFVLGYGGYFKYPGLLNKIIRYDTLFIAMQYLSFAMQRVPYMGVGRNLAYRKSEFFKNKGFASHFKILSGDDDLHVNKNARGKTTKVELDQKSFTLSEPKKTLRTWVRQKRRHFSTGKLYKPWHKFLLGFEIFTRIWFYLLFAFLLIINFYPLIVGGIFVLRLILFLITLNYSTRRFRETDLLFFGIIFDFIFPMINFLIVFSNLFIRRKNKWN